MKSHYVTTVSYQCRAVEGVTSCSHLLSIILFLLLAMAPIPIGAAEKPHAQQDEFTLKKASKVIPKGFKKLIQFAMIGDGGLTPVWISSDPIHPGFPQMNAYCSKSFHAVCFETFELIRICPGVEYKADEFRLLRPDGSEKLLQSEEGGCAKMRVPLHGPYGTYTVIMRTGAKTYRQDLPIVSPDGPRVTRLRSGLFLYNFKPAEHVRVAIYDWGGDDVLRFKAWQDFIVGDDGTLLVSLPKHWQKQRIICVAIGDSSGEASYPGKRSTSSENKIDE